MAEAIAVSIAARRDMHLVESRCLSRHEVDEILESDTPYTPCALVLVGRSNETLELQQRWLAARGDLVVLRVDVVGDVVRIGLRGPSLESLLTAVRELVERFSIDSRERVARVQLRLSDSAFDGREFFSEPTPLLEAATDWVRALLRNAVKDAPGEHEDLHGFALTRQTVLQSLDETILRSSDDSIREQRDATVRLERTLADAEASEPLDVAARVFGLTSLEFRLMVLTLAPELDFRFQRCLGFLLDDMSRRVGTLSLFGSILKLDANELAELKGGALDRWLVFDAHTGHRAAADEPARLDPFLAQWLLGESLSLEFDPRIRRVLRLDSWPGASLLTGIEEDSDARRLISKLRWQASEQLVVLEGVGFADWRALLEFGAFITRVRLIRVEAARLKQLDLLEIQECAQLIGRLIRLTDNVLVIDGVTSESVDQENDGLRLFLTTLSGMSCAAAVICQDVGSIVRLLGSVPFELVKGQPLAPEARVEAAREAAQRAGVDATVLRADEIATRYPLDVDGLELASLLAISRAEAEGDDVPDLERFRSACKELASQGISDLVDRIEPVFTLDDIVLPPDRKQQLEEIVDNVRFASRVLDGWKFGEKLPYGRGVAALFSGPSGTGKTMAAMGIAHRLGIQILRLDLSKVVSKFIGETEKNISRVFTDAQKSGAAILIDEADALLGKRSSEVTTANDRFANIEVAYLLQRMETFDGLVILTTNMRKNLDSAFLRRFRLTVEFLKPNEGAREEIWRQCLPVESHELDDADFRQLARRIDLTGGQIRQITLRAAFIAAAADRRIGLEDIERATHAELMKLGMPPIEIVRSQTRRAA